jgi:hypothetical protein
MLVTIDLDTNDISTIIIALETASKNADTQYKKMQFNKLKNMLQKTIN